MTEVIEWLESPEGEDWSWAVHWHPRAGQFVSVIDDVADEKFYLWAA